MTFSGPTKLIKIAGILSLLFILNACASNSIRISQQANSYVLTVPSSQLIMSIPKLGFMPDKIRFKEGGATDHPRYFSFNDNSGSMISGWFEEADGYLGIQGHLQSTINSWKKHGLPEPQNASLTNIDNWDVIFYEMRSEPGYVNSHMLAEWVQAGTWIELHLSITTTKSSQEAKDILLSLLNSIVVKKKA
jgi:hypothetical protein